MMDHPHENITFLSTGTGLRMHYGKFRIQHRWSNSTWKIIPEKWAGVWIGWFNIEFREYEE